MNAVSSRRSRRERLIETLDLLERQVFEELRAWRANIAELHQVGLHFILTNANRLGHIGRLEHIDAVTSLVEKSTSCKVSRLLLAKCYLNDPLST